MEFDEDGQRVFETSVRIYHLRPVAATPDPLVREMVGLAKAFLCDGELNDRELLALREWLMCNAAVMDTEPGSSLGMRLLRALGDGVIDEAERAELGEILQSIVLGDKTAALFKALNESLAKPDARGRA